MVEPDDPQPLPADASLGETVEREAAWSDHGGVHSTPPLVSGHKLGRYEIRSLLGAGGMGRVYGALDPALGREVAIKALAEAFHNDSASLKRFEREARVLATLSHPNIASIYGFEQLDGAPYLILERIEGETLADLLARGAVPLPEALEIALQVAEGLAEAHAKGVIHRDLKPSNVMLAAGRRVKLVDFGLAKTAAGERSDDVDPTTVAGAILGTAPYMSPEQIRATSVDTRTDVWAFGCLLYEMLAGRRAFPGASAPEVLAAVLRDEPQWGALPAELPSTLRRLLKSCLQKDARDRLPHIGDARRELAASHLVPLRPERLRRALRRLRPALPWFVAAGALALAGVLLFQHDPASPVRVLRLSLEPPAGLTLAGSFHAPFAIAPSGSPLVLEADSGGTTRLYLRELDDPAVRELPGTEGASEPFFAPDGRTVGFFARRKLMRVSTDGGPVLPLADIGSNPRGASWAPGGTIVFAPSQTSGLLRVPEGGGPPQTLTVLDTARGEASHRWPDVLPGGHAVLFTVAYEEGSYDEASLAAVSLETGKRSEVLSGAGIGRYLSGGLLVFVRGGRVFAVEFDPESLQARGTPREVLAGVRYDSRNGGAHLAVSISGALAYGPGVPTSPEHYLAWLRPDGSSTRLLESARAFRDPRVAPGGSRVAVVIGTSTQSDLWRLDANGALSQLSFGLSPHRPAWTPDGSRVTVGARAGDGWRLLSIPADGGGGPASALLESSRSVYPNAWSPDGHRLVYQERHDASGWDLELLELDADGRPTGAPRALAATPSHETNAVISPDGRWVAYESDELDALVQVYVRSFPEGGRKTCVSTGGARWPAFGPDGRLYYWDTSAHTLRAARLRPRGGGVLVESSAPVWPAGHEPALLPRVIVRTSGGRFDVHPSNGSFLVLEAGDGSPGPAFSLPVVVPDWAAELRSSR